MKPAFGSIVATGLALLLFECVGSTQQPTPNAISANSGSIAQSHSSPPSTDSSHIRIVRLSEVRGEVQMDRNTGRGFETAILNLPVVEGSKLRTGDGFTEVEFEDNSTLRLAPNSVVEFRQLELGQSGATTTAVSVEAGTIYAKLARTKGNEFTVSFGKQLVHLTPSSHIRLHLAGDKARLAVLAGKVQVEEPTATVVASAKRTASFDSPNTVAPVLVKSVAKGRYDTWDQAAVDYHDRSEKSSAYGSSPYAFGLSDMNYYGGFVNAADCGRIWRPYFAGAAWNPFANGAWVWYPASGYTWVSPYPWGWTAFHSGEWEFCPAYGWGWQPRDSWVGLRNFPNPIRPPHGFPRPLPPKPPDTGTSTIVLVNRKPLIASGFTTSDEFVVRKDSAGLGIPRGFENLSDLSSRVERRGSVSFEPYAGSETNGSGRASSAGVTSFARASVGRSSGAASGRESSGGAIYARSFSAAEAGRGISVSNFSQVREDSVASSGGSAAASGRK